MDTPFTVKYRPKSLEEIAGNREAIQTLVNWLNTWNKSTKNRAILLYGPSGSGKTVTVEAASSDLDYDLIEMNASD